MDGGRTVDLAVRLRPAPSPHHRGRPRLRHGPGRHHRRELAGRNFFNPEGALTLRGVARHDRTACGGRASPKQFPAARPGARVAGLASHQNFDAYEARTVLLSTDIERQSNFIWQKKWTWTYGADLLATDERGVFDSTGLKDTRTFLIAALPLSLGYDGSDSLLDPTRGFRLSGRISPEFSRTAAS